MVSTFTTNKNLEQPGRGDQVGTWDTPVNSNMAILDDSLGGTTTIALTNANVTLSAAQYRCEFIVFTGTITANIAITFPYVGSFYTIENRTAGAFTITLKTTNASAEVVGCPPFEPFEILTRASTAGVRYKNFGRIGTFWDYIGATNPTWNTACTIPPYLVCDGSAFSSATYPALATILSTTVTPDARNRVRATLSQGSVRLSTAGFGVSGATNLAAGGLETMTIGASNQAPHTHASRTSLNSNTPLAVKNGGVAQGVVGSGAVSVYANDQYDSLVISDSTGVSYPTANVQPTYIGGITLIRSA